MTQEEINKLRVGDVIFDMTQKEAYHLVKIEDACVYYEGTPHWGSIPKANLLKWNIVSLMRDQVVYCKDTPYVEQIQDEKQLLLTDLYARLPYGVMVSVQGGEFDSYKYPYLLTAVSKFGLDSFCKVYHPIYTPFGVPKVEEVKPYLRPMSSMTEEEFKEYDNATDLDVSDSSETLKANLAAKSRVRISKWYHGTDWLNAHHFDYRGLIEKGLALEAHEGMYKTE